MINDEHIGLKWFKFYVYFRIPFYILSLIFVFFSDLELIQSNFVYLSLLILIIGFYVFLFIGMYRKRMWGWHLNWFALILDVLSNPINRSKNTSEYLIAIIITGLVWFWPNLVYFNKRKFLFTAGNKNIIKKTIYGVGMFLAGFGLVILQIFSLIIHIYTIVISFTVSGIWGAIITLCMPVLSEIYWFFTISFRAHTIFNTYCLTIIGYLVTLLLIGLGVILTKRYESVEQYAVTDESDRPEYEYIPPPDEPKE